ncbi:MAG TPA: hypothetical protein VH092_28555 [Urbifossiella sp.]|jgi:hypothetical protein|nr:hypothetical protein [Urbifossiella sp.]
MRLAPWTLPAACLALASCRSANDGVPFVERTPLPRVAPPNTLARAGNPDTVASWAIPSVTKYETGGYVGGGSLLANNRPLARGVGTTAGAPGDGTFGLDYAGPRLRPGRVFLAPSPDPADAPAIADNYKTDGAHIPDVFNIRPVRKAVLEKREVLEERAGGGDHE